MERYKAKIEFLPSIDGDEASLKHPSIILTDHPRGDLLKFDDVSRLLRDVGRALSLLGSREIKVEIKGDDVVFTLKGD
jgi:hypothetical protein